MIFTILIRAALPVVRFSAFKISCVSYITISDTCIFAYYFVKVSICIIYW
jgi:hypothetical protein